MIDFPSISTMKQIVLSGLAIALGITVISGEVVAQDQQERPPLPDIAPRTVEIRGALEINFPALERQPLIGFNPPPRIVDVSERRPFVEDYRQAAADLPPSPIQAPTGPSLAGLEGIERRSGIVEARVGRFLARHTSARIEHSFDASLAITADVRYDGSDGHTPFDFEPDVRSHYDNLSGTVALHHFSDGRRMGASIGGFRSNYALFGATGSTTIPPLTNAPGREAGDLLGNVWYQTSPSSAVAFDSRLSLRGSLLNTSACPDDNDVCDDDSLYRRDQSGFEWTANVTAPQSTFAPRLDARIALSGYDTAALIGSDIVTSQIAAGGRFIDTPRMRLSIAATLMHFATGEDADRPDATALYLSPDVRLDLYPTTGVQLYAENRPSIAHPYLADVVRENPYVTHRPEMQPTVNLIDARGGLRLYRGQATIDLSGGYLLAPFYRFYEFRPDEGGYAEGLFTADHAEARIIHAGGEAALIVGGRATAGLNVRWRKATLTDEDVVVPNLGPLIARASLSMPFAQGRFLTEAGLRFESSRYRDRLETRRVGDFFDLDARASYRLNHMISAVVAVENISAGYLERWSRYPQAPFVITGGMQITW